MGKELWKAIENFEGIYEVSSKGRIKRLSRKLIRKDGVETKLKERFLNPSLTKDGYLKVHLSKDNNDYVATVHRIVAKTFIANPYMYNEINHIDEIKTNNSVENLEWITHQANCNHGTRLKRIWITRKKNEERK